MALYFRKFHTYTAPDSKPQEDLMLDYVVKDAQGNDGPPQISYGSLAGYPPFNSTLLRAWSNLSRKLIRDPISGVALGSFNSPATIDPNTKERSHTGNVHLSEDVASRKNLRIVTEALVSKVILEKGSDGTIKGTVVEFKAKDKKDTPGYSRSRSRTRHRCCENALGSRAIRHWERGGPSETRHRVPPQCLVKNPNLGEKLQDHGFVPFSWEVTDPATSGDQMRNSEVVQMALAAYNVAKAGPLSTYALAPFQITPGVDPSPQATFGMKEDGFFASMVAVLNHPFSRGSVHIRSSEQEAAPVFDQRTMSHPLDLELHARHALVLERLRDTSARRELFKDGWRRIHNGGKRVHTLDEAKEAVRDGFTPHYDVCDTAALLPRDKGGVVDPKLRVYGAEGLCVVDASALPLIPRGIIESDVYAVAERAAEILWER